MSNPRAFISFDFDNNVNHSSLFTGQIKNSKTPFNVEDWSSKTVLPQKQWQDLIESKINKCNLMIVLVGNSTSAATGVVKEITFALEQKVPLFGVYIDGAGNNTTLPTGLPRNRVIPWDWDKIAQWVSICMTQGKNK